MHKIFYAMMLIGFGGCAFGVPGWRMKIVTFLIFFVNAILYWR